MTWVSFFNLRGVSVSKYVFPLTQLGNLQNNVYFRGCSVDTIFVHLCCNCFGYFRIEFHFHFCEEDFANRMTAFPVLIFPKMLTIFPKILTILSMNLKGQAECFKQ